MKELVDFIVLAAAYVFVFYRKWKLKGKDILFLNTVMFILLKVFPISAETFESINKETTVTVSSTIWGSFALIFLSLIFLVSINHKNNQEVNLCAE